MLDWTSKKSHKCLRLFLGFWHKTFGTLDAKKLSVAPPFVIFERKTINANLIAGEVPGTLYGLSAKGWMTRELFSQWFHAHFLAYIPKHRPVILLMDGHSSHYCPETIRMAAKEQVVLCTLPPHTTHLTQPLDRSCFTEIQLVLFWLLNSRVVTVVCFKGLIY